MGLPILLAGEDDEDANVLILSYPQYCRYRSILKRIQGKPSSVQADQFVLALGGVAVISKKPQILYCRDTFEHPTLTENESVCDEFGKLLFFLFVVALPFTYMEISDNCSKIAQKYVFQLLGNCSNPSSEINYFILRLKISQESNVS